MADDFITGEDRWRSFPVERPFGYFNAEERCSDKRTGLAVAAPWSRAIFCRQNYTEAVVPIS
ncbi:hypothetical protein BaRGS_00004672, partial [Batillaria attramentaria]